MIQRFEIHNYRQHKSTVLTLEDCSSALLIGRNGTGKTNLCAALEVLRSIAQGKNRLGQSILTTDFSWGDRSDPITFHLEARVKGVSYAYSLALELSDKFKEVRILRENLTAAGVEVYSRTHADVSLKPVFGRRSASFMIDWHMAALPIIQESAEDDPLKVFKSWLSCLLLFRPIPSLIQAESEGSALVPHPSLSDLGAWFTDLIQRSPASYKTIESLAQGFLPDFLDVQNPRVFGDAARLLIQFRKGEQSSRVSLNQLSDGEKLFLAASILAAVFEAAPGTFCFWDEVDAHISVTELEFFVRELRRRSSQGQLIVTSHHPQAMRCFSSENTFLLDRRSHFEAPVIRRLDELTYEGDLADALAVDGVHA